MLPFWPKHRPIAKCYARHIRRRMVSAEGAALGQQQSALLATWYFNDTTNSPVHSLDGSRIAVGAGCSVLLLCTLGGRPALPPFEGHRSEVLSVRFSPDGIRVVSGSVDKTLRVWDTETGESVLGSLVGYTTLINSVTFSPDGSLIISGSVDNTIYVWNSRSGERTFELAGHGVKCIPEESAIVNCNLQEILVRDAKDRKLIRMWKTKITDSFYNSIDISPNGTIIALCLNGKEIVLRDLQTGEQIIEPLKAITDFSKFTCISFPPTGSCLVCGSRDGAICVWDVRGGGLILDPPEGHTDSITSANFSPYGTSMISGSDGGTLRFWDAQSIQTVFNQLPGHTGSGTSVELSPDGTRVVSGSVDSSIRVWDSENGGVISSSIGDRSVGMLIIRSPDRTRILHNCPDGLVIPEPQISGVSVGPIQLPEPVRLAAFPPDTSRILVVSRTAKILATNSREAIMNVCLPTTNQFNWARVL